MSADLAYSVHGDPAAAVVVLGSSLGTTASMWDPQLPDLATRFRVVAFDHRGHGGSDVPLGPYEMADLGRDVLALLDRLGVERFSYAGLSLGGMVGMWVASEVPHRVERLALLCTSAALEAPDAWHGRAATVRAEGMTAVADPVVARWFTPGFANAQPDVVEHYRAMILATPVQGYAGCCEAIAEMDLRDRLGRIEAPTLAIAGRQDPSIPPPHSEAIVAAVPGARLELIEEAAHLASVEQRAAITRLLIEHFGGGEEMDDLQRREAGMQARRAVLGDEHVDRAIAGTTDFSADFQDFLTRIAWGDIWQRPGLERATRSCLTIALLAALGHHEELGLHVKGALRVGVTPAEIAEVLMQVAVYAGVPAANAAFRAAQTALDDTGDAGNG